MRKVLVVKTGSTLPSLIAKMGDFEHWTLAGRGLDGDRATTVDVRSGAPLPAYDEIAGVVVTGSHAMVTDRLDWSERTAEWLRGAVAARVPALGICYGHQLLADALGGEVGDNPNGREFGTVEVRLTEDARRDPLLGAFSGSIRVQASHTQSVLRLPQGATLLAASDRDPHQAYVVGDCAWGVQFHPEFRAEVVVAYVDHYREKLLAEGQQPDGLIQGAVDTPYGDEILRRFAAMIDQDRPPRSPPAPVARD
jgi:GMP synthase (glutamine-hydrolysing)